MTAPMHGQKHTSGDADPQCVCVCVRAFVCVCVCFCACMGGWVGVGVCGLLWVWVAVFKLCTTRICYFKTSVCILKTSICMRHVFLNLGRMFVSRLPYVCNKAIFCKLSNTSDFMFVFCTIFWPLCL